jgi:RNA polymerase sigma factor for flagellar operon FliA
MPIQKITSLTHPDLAYFTSLTETQLRNRLEQKLSRTPLESEIRKAMGVSERQYNKIMRRTQSLSFISLNERTDSDDTSAPSVVESVADTHSPSPLKQIETTEMYKEIRENIANLPEKQRRVLDSYYFKDMKLSDIAKEFGLTEARICQIHSQALRNLRPKLSN